MTHHTTVAWLLIDGELTISFLRLPVFALILLRFD
jgi:hypothetical protein